MTCPACGDTTSAAASRFCEACGVPLAPQAAPWPVQPAAPCPTPSPASPCHCPPGESRPDAEGYCENCGIHCQPAPGGAQAGNPHRIVEDCGRGLALVSDLGRKHARNEDCGAIAPGEAGQAVLVVADGVSTSFQSAGASALAVKVILAMLLVAAKLCQGEAIVGWVGDSRAYLVSSVSERALTVDDSWIEEVVGAGLMTRSAANADRRAHCVTQVLGMRDGAVANHVLTAAISPGETLLLCSDGLWNYFQEAGSLARALAAIRAELGAAATAKAICQSLVAEANALGGHDNITVAAWLDA